MAVASKPRILTLRIQAEGESSNVVFELGASHVSKTIPVKHGLVRAHAILNDTGIADVEIVTEEI